MLATRTRQASAALRTIDFGYPPLAALAVILLGVAAYQTSGLKPVILDTHISYYGISVARAGDLIAGELCAAAFGTLLVSLRIHCWNRQAMAAGALLVMTLGDGLTIFVRDASWLVAARLVAGFGHGLALGVFSGAMASSRQPDRMGAIYTVAGVGLTAVVPFASPILQEAIGGGGLYLIFLAAALPAVACLHFFPRRASNETIPSAGGEDARATPIGAADTALILLAVVICYSALGGFWVYLGQFLQQAGASYARAAQVVGLGNLALVGGTLAAAMMGSRFGRRKPLLISLPAIALACVSFNLVPGSQFAYTVATILTFLAFGFFWPYCLGLWSAVDASGRVAVMGFATASLSIGIGPFVAARIVERAGLGAVIWTSSALFALSIAFFAAILRRFEMRSGLAA